MLSLSLSPSLKAEDQCPGLKAVMQGESRFSLTQPFSIQVSCGLDEAYTCWGGQSALLSPAIQILVSSRNTLPDTPRIMFNHLSGHPMARSS